jgi:hypothetical protein
MKPCGHDRDDRNERSTMRRQVLPRTARERSAPPSPVTSRRFSVVQVKILQIAPALHGANMQTTEGTYPVVIWALVERDDGSSGVVGLSVGGRGDSALVPPDPQTFESYSQTG